MDHPSLFFIHFCLPFISRVQNNYAEKFNGQQESNSDSRSRYPETSNWTATTARVCTKNLLTYTHSPMPRKPNNLSCINS